MTFANGPLECFPITQPLVADLYCFSSTPQPVSMPRHILRLSAIFQCASKIPHPRDFGNLSKLSRVNKGKHYRSDPVRVQSTSCVDLTSTDMLLLQTTPAAWDDIWTACWPPRGREKPWTEIMLWATPKGPPRALQASECRELLNPTRASCLILAQRQPGKLPPRASTLS